MFKQAGNLLLTCGVLALSAPGAVQVTRTAYQGWANCYRVTNGEIELIVTADVGPRVIRLGFVGGQNLFKEFSEQLGKRGEAQFQLRGGDRIWKSPEDPVASWAPDNVPVEIQVLDDGLIAREPVEPLTKLQKQIEIHMAASGPFVTAAHAITNHSLFPLEFAPWVLTMMAQGGMVVTGFPPRGTHPQNLAPTNPLTMWAYTDFSDPRWKFFQHFLSLRQDPHATTAQKVGLFNTDTWAAYLLNGEAFVKRATSPPGQSYPDFGSSFETFTSADFLEIETVGALRKVEPGQTVGQVEHWGLFRGVHPQLTDEGLSRAVVPLVRSVPVQ